MAKIISIVTLYYPQKIHVDNVSMIAEQSDIVALYDNSPLSNEKMYSDIKNIKFYHTGINKGLSEAFNTILKDRKMNWAENDYVIFFDQDSQIPPGHIKSLIKEYTKLKSDGISVGCIGPVFYDTSMGKEMYPRSFVRVNNHTMLVRSIVTTSMLMVYKDLERINYWNEKVFLDLADWDICWRLAFYGFKICLTDVSIIRHSVGVGNKKIGPFYLRIGKPFREYYQIRDGLYVIKNKYTPIYFKIRFMMMLIFRPVLHMMFLNEKIMRAKYIIKGICDYARGITGTLK